MRFRFLPFHKAFLISPQLSLREQIISSNFRSNPQDFVINIHFSLFSIVKLWNELPRDIVEAEIQAQFARVIKQKDLKFNFIVLYLREISHWADLLTSFSRHVFPFLGRTYS